MDWRRKAKFGFHTSKTLRKWPTCTRDYKRNTSQQFAVVKALQHVEPDRQDDYIARNKFEFDDGIPLTGESFRHFRRSYPDYPILHSMNKHKRWLLPHLVREFVERQYYYEKETKEIPCPAGKEQSESDKLRITVVERHVCSDGYAMRRSRADCFSLTSNRPALESTPVRKPTKGKLYAHVGDLDPKRISDSQAELYYEFLSPYPKNSWPDYHNRRPVHRHKFKSKKKSKGRRNRHYRHDVTHDEPMDCTLHHSLDVDHVTCHDTTSYKPGSAFSFPIGAYIDAAIQTKVNSENIGIPTGENVSSQTCSTGHFYQFGKGDAIYLESDDERLGLLFSPDETEDLPEECLAEDEKSSIQLLADSIHPDNLKQEFGEDYGEDAILPRKFIVKADLNKTMPNMFTNDCCLLFEVPDTTCTSAAVVEVQVTLLLPLNEILTKKVSKRVELELSNLKSSGPIRIRDAINLVVEKVVRECGCNSHKSSCLRKIPSNPRQTSFDFIHDICQQKPEICSFKQAVQYSMTDVAAKVFQQPMSASGDENVKTTESLQCEICFLDVDQDKGVTTTRLLQCSHGFCNACWKHYIMSCIHVGIRRILCPNFNCNTSVSEALVWSSTNSKLYQMYSKVNNQLAIDTNPALRPCPTPGCTHLAYIASTEKVYNSIPVLCHCGHLWCFACQNNAHWPASCKEAEVFRKTHGYFEDLMKIKERILSVLVKRCPFCSYPIDKGMGCAHMSCRCGKEFCWECLKPWDSHGYGECTNGQEQLEEVELTINIGNARYNKYSKVSFRNFLARSRKYLKVIRKLIDNAKMVESSHVLVSSGTETAVSSRVARSYVKSSVSSHVETMFHFKYLAHFVMENTAASAAVAKRKTMTKPLDEKIRNMEFIIGRIDELILEPIMLTDERNVAKVKMLLKNGEQLIKSMHALVELNRKN